MPAPTAVTATVDAPGGAAPLNVVLTVNGTGGTVTFDIDWGDNTTTAGAAAGSTIVHAYTTPGRYTITATATNGSGTTTAAPIIIEATPPNQFPLLDNTGGVCAPWITVADLSCPIPANPTAQLLAAQCVNTATRWLNDATCNRWAGPCTALIRPWTDPLTCSLTARRSVSEHVDVLVNRRTELMVTQRLDLTRYVTGPIRSITEVRVDGDIVDPKWYWIENGRWFVASNGYDDVDGDSPLIPWPTQDTRRQAGGPGTWSIEAIHGTGPPPPLQLATAMLACELYKSLTGDQSCQFPDRASSVTHDGVTISFQTPQPGTTGIAAIDMLVEPYGCHGKGRRRRLHDPAGITAHVARFDT